MKVFGFVTILLWTGHTLQNYSPEGPFFFEACLPAHVRSKMEVNQRTEIEEETSNSVKNPGFL